MDHPIRDVDLRAAKTERSSFADLAALYFSFALAGAYSLLALWQNLFTGATDPNAEARLTIH
jgi:hypothetical protein